MITPDVSALFSVEVLTTALFIAGIMQAGKVGLRSASEEIREHPATKVALALLPMALGALAGWLFIAPGAVHPIALGMVAGLFSQALYSMVKGALGSDRIEPRGNR